MGRKESFLERAAQTLELPPGLADLPIIELVGDKQLRVECHKGILAYGGEEIHISGGKLIIRVRGSGLELQRMNGAELVITGSIHAVELT